VRTKAVNRISQGDEGAGRLAYTIQTTNKRQYYVTRYLSFYVGNVFGLYSTCVCFLATRKLVTQAKHTDSQILS
jgi:hypothetical protein